jgi:hypothetical protein
MASSKSFGILSSLVSSDLERLTCGDLLVDFDILSTDDSTIFSGDLDTFSTRLFALPPTRLTITEVEVFLGFVAISIDG